MWGNVGLLHRNVRFLHRNVRFWLRKCSIMFLKFSLQCNRKRRERVGKSCKLVGNLRGYSTTRARFMNNYEIVVYFHALARNAKDFKSLEMTKKHNM